jgi:hypothetical protein
MPSPLFTSVIFPKPVVLEPDPIVVSAQNTQPLPNSQVGAASAFSWKPDVFVLGNKPLP